MKLNRSLCGILIGAVIGLMFLIGAVFYDAGKIHGWREAAHEANRAELKPNPKTEFEAWEAAKMFVAASVPAASFGGQQAFDVVERTGDGSFTIRAIVYTQDANGEITAKKFFCEMTWLEGEKWHGVLTMTDNKRSIDLEV